MDCANSAGPISTLIAGGRIASVSDEIVPLIRPAGPRRGPILPAGGRQLAGRRFVAWPFEAAMRFWRQNSAAATPLQ